MFAVLIPTSCKVGVCRQTAAQSWYAGLCCSGTHYILSIGVLAARFNLIRPCHGNQHMLQMLFADVKCSVHAQQGSDWSHSPIMCRECTIVRTYCLQPAAQHTEVPALIASDLQASMKHVDECSNIVSVQRTSKSIMITHTVACLMIDQPTLGNGEHVP